MHNQVKPLVSSVIVNMSIQLSPSCHMSFANQVKYLAIILKTPVEKETQRQFPTNSTSQNQSAYAR